MFTRLPISALTGRRRDRGDDATIRLSLWVAGVRDGSLMFFSTKICKKLCWVRDEERKDPASGICFVLKETCNIVIKENVVNNSANGFREWTCSWKNCPWRHKMSTSRGDITEAVCPILLKILTVYICSTVYICIYLWKRHCIYLWKRQVAEDMINGLSERRLARTISAQVCGEIKSAHSMFLSNLTLLEKQLQCSLADNERRHRQLKSVHAPRLARLALRTEAINNRINHGLPELSGELGRGNFGVVYSCAGWGPFAPCAVKTAATGHPAVAGHSHAVPLHQTYELPSSYCQHPRVPHRQVLRWGNLARSTLQVGWRRRQPQGR